MNRDIGHPTCLWSFDGAPQLLIVALYIFIVSFSMCCATVGAETVSSARCVSIEYMMSATSNTVTLATI